MNSAQQTAFDKAAVTILRRAYERTEVSDVLFNARMYLQDRARYEKLFKASRVEREQRAGYYEGRR